MPCCSQPSVKTRWVLGAVDRVEGKRKTEVEEDFRALEIGEVYCCLLGVRTKRREHSKT